MWETSHGSNVVAIMKIDDRAWDNRSHLQQLSEQLSSCKQALSHTTYNMNKNKSVKKHTHTRGRKDNYVQLCYQVFSSSY